MTVSAWSPERCQQVLDSVTGPGPVLRALQAIQAEFGFVPPPSVQIVADTYNVSRADVHGVLTFYSDLRTDPPPAIDVRVCLGEACQAVGARSLLAQARAHADADCEVASIYCLGNCALGPSATVQGVLQGRVTADGLAASVATARADMR